MKTDIDFEFWDAQMKHFIGIIKSNSASSRHKKIAKKHLIEIQTRLKRDVRELNIYIKELETQL